MVDTERYHIAPDEMYDPDDNTLSCHYCRDGTCTKTMYYEFNLVGHAV